MISSQHNTPAVMDVYQLTIHREKHDNNLVAAISNDHDLAPDVSIVCDDGKIVDTHRMILALHSKLLDDVFKVTSGLDVMISLNVSFEALKGLLEVIATGIIFTNEKVIVKDIKDAAISLGISSESLQLSDMFENTRSVVTEEKFIIEELIEDDLFHDFNFAPIVESKKKIKEEKDDANPMKNELSEVAEIMPCLSCPKTFSSKSALQRHVTTHSEGKRFACEACNKEFTRKDVLKKHSAAVHSENQNGSFGCNSCNKIFKWKHSFQRHERNVHGLINQDIGDYASLESIDIVGNKYN